jgi:CRISPR-associated protein Csd1
MTMLQSLARAYDRFAERGEVATFGFSPEKIGYVIELEADGRVRRAPTIRGQIVKGKHQPAIMQAPQARKRTVGIDPNFLWDKTDYVLGVTGDLEKLTEAEREKRLRRVAQTHQAFVDFHVSRIAEIKDEGLQALKRFLLAWRPEQFETLGWPAEMLAHNVAFAFGVGEGAYLHERPAARALWAAIQQPDEADAGPAQPCLVSGDSGPVARLHPSIKGVPGAQSSGASLVSFNKDAFTS